MGARIAFDRAFGLHDSNGWPFSLEFSMAAIFPSRSCNLCGGGVAAQTGVNNPGYSGACTRRFYRRCRIDLPHEWFVRFSAHLDFFWIGFGLGVFLISAALRCSRLDTCRNHVLRVARDIRLHPDELRSSQI